VRRAVEPNAGLSHARNAALRLAAGRTLIFIDDDVTVPPGWFARYADGFARHPGAGFFGGPIIAVADGAPESWMAALKEVMPGALSWLDPNLEECILTKDSPHLPWGANMAIRRSALGGLAFDVSFNRSPENPLAVGEESRLFEDLMDSGVTGLWLPSAGLMHHVGAARCSKDYLRRYCVNVGRYQGRKRALQGKQDPEDVRRWARKEIQRLRRRYYLTVPWVPLAQRLAALRDLALREGFLQGYLDIVEEKKGNYASA
jgi:glycosyltransferase involved in cell wall biosynthesis